MNEKQMSELHHAREKRCHFIFDHDSRMSWSIFYIFFTNGNGNEYCL